jgi:hypothetical protein
LKKAAIQNKNGQIYWYASDFVRWLGNEEYASCYGLYQQSKICLHKYQSHDHRSFPGRTAHDKRKTDKRLQIIPAWLLPYRHELRYKKASGCQGAGIFLPTKGT